MMLDEEYAFEVVDLSKLDPGTFLDYKSFIRY